MDDFFSQQTYVIAYIDVLGTTERIKHNPEKAIQDVWVYCHRTLKKSYNTKIKAKVFSDNILICEEINELEPYQAIVDVLNVVHDLQTTMINACSSFLRGGVTIGSMHCDENFILGEGLLRAYELESKVALFPRIVIDKPIFQYVKRNAPFFKRDFDGQYFYSFLYNAGYSYLDPQTKEQRYYVEWSNFKNRIIATMMQTKIPSVVQKMSWLINYLQDYFHSNNKEDLFSQEELKLINNILYNQ